MTGYKYCTVKQCKPKCCGGYDLYSEGDCLMKHEIGNICLAGLSEIKADGFNSERIEEMAKIIGYHLIKKLN